MPLGSVRCLEAAQVPERVRSVPSRNSCPPLVFLLVRNLILLTEVGNGLQMLEVEMGDCESVQARPGCQGSKRRLCKQNAAVIPARLRLRAVLCEAHACGMVLLLRVTASCSISLAFIRRSSFHLSTVSTSMLSGPSGPQIGHLAVRFGWVSTWTSKKEPCHTEAQRCSLRFVGFL